MRSFGLIVGVSMLGMSVTGALAADLEMAPEPMPVVDWSGGYFGVGLGGYGSKNKLSLTGDPALLNVLDPNNLQGASIALGSRKTFGFAGGGFLGYNFAIDNFVLGIEGDVYGLTGKKSVYPAALALPVGLGGQVRGRVKDQMSYSVRGRLGYAVGDFMPYITGGWQGAKQKVTLSNALYSSSSKKTLSGYTIGGGVEWLANGMLGLDVGTATVRFEYRYSDYGKQNWSFATPVAGVNANVRTKNTANQFLVGFAWKY